MNILILREADIHRACTMPEAIDAACEALRLYSTGVCDIPLRTTIAVPEGPGSSLYMYGYAAPAGALGVKIVSSFPENAKRGLPSTPSTMVLLDAQAGAVCALLDGTYFTRLRTGALAGAATRLLAREDSRVFTIYGPGVSARVADLVHRGRLAIGAETAQDNLMGQRFTGRAVAAEQVGGFPAVRVEISGTAYKTGSCTFLIDENDPLTYGFPFHA